MSFQLSLLLVQATNLAPAAAADACSLPPEQQGVANSAHGEIQRVVKYERSYLYSIHPMNRYNNNRLDRLATTRRQKIQAKGQGVLSLTVVHDNDDVAHVRCQPRICRASSGHHGAYFIIV